MIGKVDRVKIERLISSLQNELESCKRGLEELRGLIAGTVDDQEPSTIQSEETEGICHKCKTALGDETPVRGCHMRCYRSMMRAISAGDVTESELISQGLLAHQKAAGRKPEPGHLAMIIMAPKLANVPLSELDNFCRRNGLEPVSGGKPALKALIEALESGKVKPAPGEKLQAETKQAIGEQVGKSRKSARAKKPSSRSK